ncbi:MAG: hypothetical protein NWE87_03250 [Candidatus Bathyarchaeota archaeon]|nr:hypothetical protein [Candidatus Bathyarchaeota archaeon]
MSCGLYTSLGSLSLQTIFAIGVGDNVFAFAVGFKPGNWYTTIQTDACSPPQWTENGV